MVSDIVEAFDEVDADDEVGAVIVTGEGRAFCAGADLGAGGSTFDSKRRPDAPFHADGTPDHGKESARDSGGKMTLRIFQSLKPVIAAVNAFPWTFVWQAQPRGSDLYSRVEGSFPKPHLLSSCRASWVFLKRLNGATAGVCLPPRRRSAAVWSRPFMRLAI
jgi:hypothetical protein